LNARYYNGGNGRFVSQDVFARDNPEKFLTDPQQMNYYSYARGNPITNSDPTGNDSAISNFFQTLSNFVNNFGASVVGTGGSNAPAQQIFDSSARAVGKAEPAMRHGAGDLTQASFAVGGSALGPEGSALGMIVGGLEKSQITGEPYTTGQAGFDVVMGSLHLPEGEGAYTEAGLIKDSVIKNSKTIASGAVEGGVAYLRQAERLAAQYGGNAEDWVKNVSKDVFDSPTGLKYQVHYYMNTATDLVVETKSKIINIFKR
jgi:hypothetical protein